MKQPIKATIQIDETMKNKTNVNIGQILKQPISRKPISAQFIQTKKVNVKPFIKPLKGPHQYNEKDREYVETWLCYTSIGTQIVETGTRMLSHKGLINGRDGVFDLITSFKQLNKHFTGNENYDQKELGIDDFIFNFLTLDDEQQLRVIKFQESIMNKKR